jgi:hypothetical protein
VPTSLPQIPNLHPPLPFHPIDRALRFAALQAPPKNKRRRKTKKPDPKKKKATLVIVLRARRPHPKTKENNKQKPLSPCPSTIIVFAPHLIV